jgi:hypothetical protein
MVSDKNYVNKISFRHAGTPEKKWIDGPTTEALDNFLNSLKTGQIECLTLYGPGSERLFIIGKPNFYHVTIFVDESEGYGYDDGTGDRSNIDIAGDFWPSFRVCKSMEILRSISHKFFSTGKPSESEHWIYFSDDE